MVFVCGMRRLMFILVFRLATRSGREVLACCIGAPPTEGFCYGQRGSSNSGRRAKGL